MPTQAIEEYLESIYKLDQRGGKVIAARLAEDLGVSAPTVTEMLRRLRKKGLVVTRSDKEIVLTDAGREAAEVLIRRHRLSERLLTDILGMPWSQAHEEACKFEHVISPAVEARLLKILDDPATCPHGNPIPGHASAVGLAAEATTRLSEAPVGSRAVLRCIEAEDEELLTYVEGLGLVPGAEIGVLGFAPLDGPVELVVEGERVSVGLAAAERLMVSVVEPASG